MIRAIAEHHCHDVWVCHALISWEKAKTVFECAHRAVLSACNCVACLARVAWLFFVRHQDCAARMGCHPHLLLMI